MFNRPRYLLFAGRLSRPRGGWADYVDAFDRLEDALHVGGGLLKLNGGREDWYHVVDSRFRKVVVQVGSHATGAPRIEV